MISYTKNIDNIIKSTNDCIIFRTKKYIYKQYKLNSLKWIKEINLVNYIHHIYNHYDCLKKYIINYNDIQIIEDTDFVYKPLKNKLYTLPKKDKFLQIKMLKHKEFNIDRNKLDNHIYELLLILLINNSLSILHRDLKISNIMLDVKNHHIILIDFGLAIFHINENNNIYSNQMINTTYKPPELIFDEKNMLYYDRKISSWSFGMLLLNMLTDNNFYTYFLNNYGKNGNNLKIILNEYLSKYGNIYTIKYKYLITRSIISYDERSSIKDLIMIFIEKNKYNNLAFQTINLIENMTNDKVFQVLNHNIETTWINKLHDRLFNDNNIVFLRMFYKLKKELEKVKFNKHNSFKKEIKYLSMYILILHLFSDVNILMEKIIKYSVEHIPITESTMEKYYIKIEKDIKNCIIYLLKNLNYNIYNNILNT